METTHVPAAPPVGGQRRFVRAAFGVLAVGAFLGLWAFVLEPAVLLTERVTLDLPGLGTESLKVAVLTDLHVGSPFHSLRKLEKIVRRTNEVDPDVVVILGDLVIHGVIGGRFVPPEPIGEALGGLRAPRGVFAVLGNHDHWLDADRVRRTLEAQGITVLFDSAAPLPPLGRREPSTGRARVDSARVWVGGVSDYWEGPHDIPATLASVPLPDPVILITHNPDIFPEVPARVALTIAGHTHGGQVRFPLVGAPVVPSDFGQRYVAGHVIEGGRHLFVSTGTGTSMLPVRFRVPPRITLLHLRGGGSRGGN